MSSFSAREDGDSMLKDNSSKPSTRVNVAEMQTCEASINGVPCWRHADEEYITSEDITKHLCKLHYSRILFWHDDRVQQPDMPRNQRGRVA